LNNDNQQIPVVSDNKPNSARRRFVGSAMRLPLAFFVPVGALDAQASVTPVNMSPEQRVAMVQRMIYLLFPLDNISEGPYQRSVAVLLDKIEQDTARMTLIDQGLNMLNQATAGDWLAADESAQVDAMKSIEQSPFFQFMYGNAQATLFNDQEVWDAIDYGGSALTFGGYRNNLVEDIEWIEGGN